MKVYIWSSLNKLVFTKPYSQDVTISIVYYRDGEKYPEILNTFISFPPSSRVLTGLPL